QYDWAKPGYLFHAPSVSLGHLAVTSAGAGLSRARIVRVNLPIHEHASGDGCAYLFGVRGLRLITKGAVQWSGIPAGPRQYWRSNGRIRSNRDTFRRQCRIVFNG